MVFTLGLFGVPVPDTGTYRLHISCTGTYWNPWPLHWSSLGLSLLVLGCAGTPMLSAGTHWNPHPSSWDTLGLIHCILGPAVPPALGPPALAGPGGLWSHHSGAQPPFMCGSGCLQSTPALPPDKAGGRILCPGLFGESHGCLLGPGTHYPR